MGIYEDLVWRGLIKDESSPEIRDLLNKGGVTFYIGTDPTGDSLHIGHFSSFLISKRLKDAGHNPILLVGGGTGLIGDPKPDAERPMITVEEVNHNFECLKAQAEKIFGFEVVNNYDWLKDFSYIDWLRDVGKFFNIGYMLNKDIVRRRLDEGITYKTGKVTVSPKLRNLEMKYRDIRNFSRGWLACFPTVTVTMADGESYKFIVFRPGSFCGLLENRIGGQSS